MSQATLLGYSLEPTHGVLIVKLRAASLTSDTMLADFQEHVVTSLADAKTAVLIDCQSVTGHASTQFLTTLVAIRRAAEARGIFVCVCCLTGSLREAFDVCHLGRIIPAYDDKEVALEAVGNYSPAEIKQRKIVRTHNALYHQDDEPVETESQSSRSAWLAALRRWVRPQQGVLPVVVVGGWVLLCLAIVWLSVAGLRSRAPQAAPNKVRPAFSLSGQIVLTSGEQRFGDADAVVLAWRCDDPPPTISAAEIRSLLDASRPGPYLAPGVYVARTTRHGLFELPVDTPGEYQSLVLSNSRRNSAGLAAEDDELLADFIDSPRTLVGESAYRLHREVVDRPNVRIVETFALAH